MEVPQEGLGSFVVSPGMEKVKRKLEFLGRVRKKPSLMVSYMKKPLLFVLVMFVCLEMVFLFF